MQPSTTTPSSSSLSFNPDELANIKQQYGAYQASNSNKTTARPKAGGIRGVLQGLLPVAGGALGAIGGGLLGGPAGAIAGGAAGSGAGEALKEHFQGGGLSVKNIGEQAALGALPGVGSGIKTLRAGGAVADLFKGADAAGAATQAVKPNLATKVYNKGVITESRAGGFGQGEKLSGGESQGFRQSEQNSQTLANEGITGSNASSRQIAVGDKLAQHSKTIDMATEAKNPAVTDAQKADIVGRVQSKIIGGGNGTGIPGYVSGDNANSKFAMALANQFSTIKDAKGMLGFKRALDQQAINYGRNSAAPDPIKEQIAKAFRQEVNTDFGKMVPEAKVASTSYAKLHDANEFLKQAARDQSNSSTQSSGGITGRLLTSDTAETLKSKGGRGLQTLGRAMGAQTGGVTAKPMAPAIGKTAQVLRALTSPVQVGKAAFKQSAGRAAVGLLGAGAGTDQQQPTTQLADASLQLGGNEPTTASAPTSSDQTTNSPYSLQSYLTDVSRDPKNETAYTAIFKELNPSYGSSNNGLNVTKVTSQQYGLAQTGSQALQQLNQMLQSNPNVVNKAAIPGQTLPIVGGLIGHAAGTEDYNTLGYNIADTILRLRTGAQANDSEVKDLQGKLMPRAGDSPEEIQTKLQQMQAIFNSTLQLANNQGAGSATTADLAGALGQ